MGLALALAATGARRPAPPADLPTWGVGVRPAPGAAESAALLFGGAIDLNVATAEDLMSLPGIGPRRAARIIEQRRARGGRFDSVDDLLDVPGIGRVTLENLRGRVRVEPSDEGRRSHAEPFSADRED